MHWRPFFNWSVSNSFFFSLNSPKPHYILKNAVMPYKLHIRSTYHPILFEQYNFPLYCHLWPDPPKIAQGSLKQSYISILSVFPIGHSTSTSFCIFLSFLYLSIVISMSLYTNFLQIQMRHLKCCLWRFNVLALVVVKLKCSVHQRKLTPCLSVALCDC